MFFFNYVRNILFSAKKENFDPTEKSVRYMTRLDEIIKEGIYFIYKKKT